METFISNVPGRIVVIRLGKGEKVLESIKIEIERLGIKNGVVLSGIGSMRKAGIHFISSISDLPADQFLTIEDPIEMASLQGLILDGQPHFHVVLSDLKRAYAGHLEPGCEVQYLAEITIMEVADMNLTRKPDEFGVSYILEK